MAEGIDFVDPPPVRAGARPVGRPRCAHWDVRGGHAHGHPRRPLSTERPRSSIRHSHKGAGEPVLYSPLREHRLRVSVSRRAPVLAWRCVPVSPGSADRSEAWPAVALVIVAWIPFVPGGIAPFGWEFVLMLAPPVLIAMTFLRVGLLAQFALLLMDLLIRVPSPSIQMRGTSATLSSC